MDSHVAPFRNEGEVEEHPEKMSVMKKMKVKARKLKHSIAGHGHHDQEQEVDQDLDEDDDEETVVGSSPEVSGAPRYDSGVGKTDSPLQGDIYKTPVRSFGDTKAGRDEFDSVPKESSNVNVTDPIKSNAPAGLHDATGYAHNSGATRKTEPVVKHGQEPKVFGGAHAPHNTPVSSAPMDVDPVKTSGSGKGGLLGESRLGKTDVLGEDTPLPQSSGVSSLDHGTRKSRMDVDPKQTYGQGGHSDESNVNPSKYETKVTDPAKSGGEESGVTPVIRSFDKMNLHGDKGQHLNNDANQDISTGSHDQQSSDTPSKQGGSYVSSATSAVTGTAMSAKNVVASKLGYGGTGTGSSPPEHQSRGGTIEPDHNAETEVKSPNKQGGSYVSSATSAVTGTAVSAKNAVASKLGYGGTPPPEHQNRVVDPSTNEFKEAETPGVRGTIEPDHNTETEVKSPNKQGGSYISSATSAVTGTAVSAKNAVASKLGYGGTDSGSSPREHQNRDPSTNELREAETPQVRGTTEPDHNTETEVKSPNRSYISSATSVITSAKNAVATRLGYGPSDQVHDSPASPKPMGKVTESAEVKQRLGNTEGNDNFVVTKIEESVGSMLGGTKKNDDGHQQGLSSSGSTGDRKAEATGL